MRALAVLLMAVGVANPQAAIRNPQSNDPPGHLVQMDVTAINARGQAVLDLKPTDFELREEGAAQAVDRIRLVKDEPRLVAVFLDEYHVGAEATVRVREAMAAFVDRELSPRDLLVVMKPLDSLFAIRLTLDRADARRAIETFEGRKGDYEPRNAYERDYIAGTPARIEAARGQVALSAINALAVQLGSIADRRKTLIVVTEEIGRGERRRGQEYLPTLDTIVRSANRWNVAVYPLDPTGAPPAAADDPRGDALRVLAAETDGQTASIDLARSLKRAAADSTDYYLLTYRSVQPDDGKFRGVNVRVTRPGVTLRARKGYFGPSPDEAMRVALIARMNEPRVPPPVEPAPHASTLVRPWFGMSRGDGGKTRVTFVWEPAPRVPGERVRHSASRLVLTALGGDGTVLFEGPVAPTGPAALDEPGTTPARAVFDAAPGRLRLRMAIQDAASQVIDRDVRELSIRDLRGAPALGTPEILRARNAREFRTLDGGAAVPVAAREFSRTEHLLVRFQAYGPAGARPVVSAKLLGRMGQVVRDLSVAPAATPDGGNAIDLPLAGLAAGEYTIELTASSAAGDVKDRVGFRVTS
ncbi:MAG TPA: VWA domain-containing protein [Vicinamibacterales bacterium]|jgi:Ca-activated chloride channel family protein|nr:VWA domain-containing protein [Vicinamibacterales bacterium]